MSVASLRQHSKPKNANKPRLSPKQCREVTDHWVSRRRIVIGTLELSRAEILHRSRPHRHLVRQYINPSRLPSAKGPLTTFTTNSLIVFSESTPSSAHSTLEVVETLDEATARPGTVTRSSALVRLTRTTPTSTRLSTVCDKLRRYDECDFYDQELSDHGRLRFPSRMSR
jgi:hypothetical protein